MQCPLKRRNEQRFDEDEDNDRPVIPVLKPPQIPAPVPKAVKIEQAPSVKELELAQNVPAGVPDAVVDAQGVPAPQPVRAPSGLPHPDRVTQPVGTPSRARQTARNRVPQTSKSEAARSSARTRTSSSLSGSGNRVIAAFGAPLTGSGRGGNFTGGNYAENLSTARVAEAMLARNVRLGRTSGNRGRARRQAVTQAEEIVRKAREGAGGNEEGHQRSRGRAAAKAAAATAAVAATAGIVREIVRSRGGGGGGLNMRAPTFRPGSVIYRP